jgi:hypothetical protein
LASSQWWIVWGFFGEFFDFCKIFFGPLSSRRPFAVSDPLQQAISGLWAMRIAPDEMKT